MPVSEKKEPKDSGLATEARFIRQMVRRRQADYRPSDDPIWKKLVYFLIISSVLSAVLLLLFLPARRRQMLDSLVTEVSDLYLDDSSKVFRLPPPSARPAREITIQIGAPPGGAARTTERPFEGGREAPLPSAATSPAEAEASAEFLPPPKTQGSEEALKMLLDSSPVAGRLRENRFPGYQFQEWKPVRDASPLFWIEFTVVRQSDHSSLSVIWEVNLDSGQIRPLSQAARDLELEGKGMKDGG